MLILRPLALGMILPVWMPVARAAEAQDTESLEEARERSYAYERSLRSYAPFPTQKPWFRCDEWVGRFCLQYAHGRNVSIRPEPIGLQDLRARAIEAYRGAAREAPRDWRAWGPWVRLLVEGGRTVAAVETALDFVTADTADARGYVLLGFALDADGQTAAAERAFDAALSRLGAAERERAADARDLLAPAEREVYARLSASQRSLYRAALWRAADPLYLTAGNEVRAEHFTRYVYARLLEDAPAPRPSVSRFSDGVGIPRWREDIEELTRRFGVPAGTMPEGECDPTVWNPSANDYWDKDRDGRGAFCVNDGTVRGYYDPEQLTYVPPQFSRERLPPVPKPGTEDWIYGPAAIHNGFRPRTVRRMRPLEHQLSRFPAGDSTVLRADIEFFLEENVGENPPVELGLFVLDSALSIVSEARDTVAALDRLARGWIETRLPPGAFGYSVEAREVETGLAARARHPLPAAPAGELVVSDLVLLPAGRGNPERGSVRFRPFGSLLIERERELAIYLEIHGLEANMDGRVRYRLDLEVVEGAEAAGGGPRLTWTEEAPASEDSLAVTVNLGRLPTGGGLLDRLNPFTSDSDIHRLVLTATDLVSGSSATVERLAKIE